MSLPVLVKNLKGGQHRREIRRWKEHNDVFGGTLTGKRFQGRMLRETVCTFKEPAAVWIQREKMLWS